MELLGAFVGALVATMVVSRALLFVLPKRDGRDIAAFVLSLAACWTTAAFGSADGGPPRWEAGYAYILPQLIWLSFDLFRVNLAKERSASRETPSPALRADEPKPGEVVFWQSIAAPDDEADLRA